MTTTQPVPHAGAHPQMAPAAEARPDPVGPATTPGTAPSKWAKLTDNPWQTFLSTALVAMLIFTLTRADNRIDRLEDRFDRLEAKVDARFDAQDAKIDEINLKLTALIAALNATDQVGAALEGRLLDPEAEDTGTAPAN